MPTPQKYDSNADRQKAFRDRQKVAREQAIAQGAPKAAAVPTMPSTGRWNALIAQARAALDTARAEMQDYYDERSEQWQESEKAEQMQQRIEQLESIISELDET
jgi:hypothetical protein